MPAWHDAILAYGSAIWAIRPQVNHFAVAVHQISVQILTTRRAKDTTMPVRQSLVCTWGSQAQHCYLANLVLPGGLANCGELRKVASPIAATITITIVLMNEAADV